MESHQHLRAFSKYLEENYPSRFDIPRLKKEVEEKLLFFNSNIPLGHGVGSSGALVAAFLHAFGTNLPETLEEKKELFGNIESHFHGKSSGLDVLVCFENQAIRIEQSALCIEPNVNQELFARFELVSTHAIGLTAEMVNTFKAQGSDFKERFRSVYVYNSNLALAHFLSGNAKDMFKACKALSRFTFEEMPWTVPNSFKEEWRATLDDPKSTYKLCGSGGGGFVLKFSMD